MLEVQSPAGSPEGVVAAVQNGADAVFFRLERPGAREISVNFTNAELGRALEYCRVRGVKAYLSIDTLAFDRELPQIVNQVKEAAQLGIDAISISDPGVMIAVRQALPDIPLHAGTLMGVHNLEGVRVAAAMGMGRVSVSDKLSRRELSYICRNTPVDIDVLVHGELCISYCGQCYMSAAVGQHSANRGVCEKHCRHSYSSVGHSTEHPLSLKGCSLLRYIIDLETIGVSGVWIDDRTNRPEYTAIVTGMCSKAAHRGRLPTQEDLRSLQKLSFRHGLTDGYYIDRKGVEMMGGGEYPEEPDSIAFSTARKNYLNGEFQRVPVRFVGTIRSGKRVKIAAMDDRKNYAVVYGPVPSPAFHTELTVTSLQTQLHKTFGTPFYCAGVKGVVEPGLTLPATAFNQMRRSLLADILEQRKVVPTTDVGEFTPSGHVSGYDAPPVLTVSVMKSDQLSKAMEELCPEIIYIPVMELDFDSPELNAFLQNDAITVVASLPKVIHDNERRKVSELLTRALELGISDILAGNIGHILYARSYGMGVRGDYSLNIFNSESLHALSGLKLKSITLPMELRLSEIREISKPVDTELIVYGRMPLMITESCIVKNITGACTCDNFTGISDKQSRVFPIVPEYGCRNILLSNKKIFMADKQRATSQMGLWAERLSFTTENAHECVAIMKRYMGVGEYEHTGHTRGLYYRGVL